MGGPAVAAPGQVPAGARAAAAARWVGRPGARLAGRTGCLDKWQGVATCDMPAARVDALDLFEIMSGGSAVLCQHWDGR